MRRRFAVLVMIAALLVIGAAGSAHAATGSQLISQYGCMGCHSGGIPKVGTDAASEAAAIYSAINGGMMNGISSLKTLTQADALTIAQTLFPAGPAACTSYTYTLGACQPDGTAPVVSSVGVPAGCSGGATPATTQPCTYTPPSAGACTSFTYSAWGACQADGTQTRTVASSSPAGCTGGTPVTSQSCTYTPPVSSAMPLPTSEQVFPFDPVASPAPSTDPNQAMPMGLGAVATGGDTLTLHITAAFQSPMKLFVTMYTPSSVSFVPSNMKMLNGNGMFKSTMAGNGGVQVKKWKNGVTSVDETVINNVPLSQLKHGLYYVVMTATPATGTQNFYQWVTYFIVP
jgi:cytochrome c551/c552